MRALQVSASYDEQVDASYIRFHRDDITSVRQVVVEDEDLGNMSVILDVSEDGKLLGIELLNVSLLVANPRFIDAPE